MKKNNIRMKNTKKVNNLMLLMELQKTIINLNKKFRHKKDKIIKISD